MKKLVTFTAFFLIFAGTSFARSANADAVPTIQEKTAGMKEYPGYFTFYWDAKEGRIWLEISRWNEQFLYVNTLPHGVGSNDIGLDRGQIGNERIVEFVKSGPKVLLLQPNYSFRATSGNEMEKLAAREAFAQSALWGFNVAAENGDTVLVDATDFLLRDAHHVIETLRDERQGSYRLDPGRSAIYMPRTKNFPDNSEFEAIVTFVGDNPGRWVEQVVPSPDAITVHVHNSFIKLPDDGYVPRAYDPRAGYFDVHYMDFSAPLGDAIHKRLITRHWLQKKDPNAAVSEPVKQIVYYVDPGAPQPIRDALIQGASWWDKAFEAAGFKNAFQVKVLPDSVDPMDIRYNVIQWVDRYTRGWSYGESIVDPRTGEIIKGQVTLDALRARQDYLIAQGLLAPYADGKNDSAEIENFVLARIRQLAAHETGHTLGLAHNFASSTDNRASVMDYPAPLIKINKDGTFDVSDAYAKGIGKWDIQAIRYGYEEFPKGTDEKKALDGIIENGIKEGIPFISDEGTRPPGSASPIAHLWDNGPDAVDGLNQAMQVRAIALKNFGEGNIKPDEPLAHLEDVLVPVYMYHRYETVAASKVLGGLYYTYAVRGDGQVPTKMVPAAEQRRALTALLGTIKPDFLALPENILKLIPPQPDGYRRTREDFVGKTGVTFDALAPARSAAQLTVGLVLNPERDNRLVQYHGEDKNLPGLDEVIDDLVSASWKSPSSTGYLADIRRSVENIVLNNLMSLAVNGEASEQVRAIAYYKIDALKDWIGTQLKSTKDEDQRAECTYALSQIKQFQENPVKFKTPTPVEIPPGDPIGEY